MTRGACPKGEHYFERMLPLPLIPKGRRSFVERGRFFWRGVMVLSSMTKGNIVD